MSKVSYTKGALTYAQQLQQLKDRGLKIENEQKALHLLENISYYRLSGYWYPLLVDYMLESSNSTFNFGDQKVVSLSKILAEKYKGRTISAQNLFKEHQPNSLYCGTHYVKILRDMVERGMVKAKFTDDAEHKVTVLLTDKCILNFN